MTSPTTALATWICTDHGAARSGAKSSPGAGTLTRLQYESIRSLVSAGIIASHPPRTANVKPRPIQTRDRKPRQNA